MKKISIIFLFFVSLILWGVVYSAYNIYVPPPPQSRKISTQEVKFNNQPFLITSYFSKADRFKILNFYKSDLSKRGWKLLSDETEEGGDIHFSKNDYSLNITIRDELPKETLVIVSVSQSRLNNLCPTCNGKISEGISSDTTYNNYDNQVKNLDFIPHPPNSKPLFRLDNGKVTQLSYSANSMSLEDLKKYYRMAMKNYGWELEQEVSLEKMMKDIGDNLDIFFKNNKFKNYFKDASYLFYKGKRGKVMISFTDTPQGAIANIQYTAK